MSATMEVLYGHPAPLPPQMKGPEAYAQPDIETEHQALLTAKLATAATGATVEIDYDAEALSLIRTMAPELLSPADAEAQRLQALQSLPHQGFEGAEHVYDEMVGQIAAIGFPIKNFRNFVRSDNSRPGKRHTYASWGIGTANNGEYMVHHLLETAIPEKRLATYGHESAHANTPFLEQNADQHGGEAKRREAVAYIEAAAMQAQITGVTLNGYHKSLLEQLNNNQIDFATFAEETWAITCEMALTDRAGVEIAQQYQLKGMEDYNRTMRVHGGQLIEPVQLISTADRHGNIEATGIDKLLVTTLEGVNDFDDLLVHIGSLKQRFYGADESQTATQRFVTQNVTELERIAEERGTISIHEGKIVFWALQHMILRHMAEQMANRHDDTADESDDE